jgi:hypothetical protein
MVAYAVLAAKTKTTLSTAGYQGTLTGLFDLPGGLYEINAVTVVLRQASGDGKNICRNDVFRWESDLNKNFPGVNRPARRSRVSACPFIKGHHKSTAGAVSKNQAGSINCSTPSFMLIELDDLLCPGIAIRPRSPSQRENDDRDTRYRVPKSR